MIVSHRFVAMGDRVPSCLVVTRLVDGSLVDCLQVDEQILLDELFALCLFLLASSFFFDSSGGEIAYFCGLYLLVFLLRNFFFGTASVCHRVLFRYFAKDSMSSKSMLTLVMDSGQAQGLS